MKKLLEITIFITTTILLINSTFAIEKSSINLEKNPSVFNTEKNIQQARLMEMEVSTFKNKLSIIQTKYNLENDATINKSLEKLNKTTFILRKIQTTRVNKYVADNVIKIIINDLKNINIIIKNHLKKIKSLLDNKRQKYNSLSKKLSINVDKIILTFSRYYKHKKNITSDDKKIIILLQKLESNSNELKNFSYKKIYNTSDIKKSLISILIKVRKNIFNIKKSFKK